MRESVIVSAVRTPTGKFLGALKGFTATQLGALAIAEAVRRAGIDPQIVDECIMGNVVSAGLGQNPARQAALNGGLPDHVAALTINKVCGSGLKAVMIADQAIRAGDIDVAVAGGMESMSNCPYLLPRVRDGLRMGNGEVVDSMINDGLWCAFEQCHMGNSGEVVAEHCKVGRAAQDDYAARSHQKAARATSEGAFADEILPITIPQKKGDPLVVDRDEGIRADTTAEGLAALKPAFRAGGTVTAGNSSGLNDGAAAVVVASEEKARALGLEPLGAFVASAVAGVDPRVMGIGPVPAVRKLLDRTGVSIDAVDLVELNEAFASQSVAVARELGIDEERLNVNGGAIAIGHPLGMSGARLVVSLLHELRRRGGKRGIVTMCVGVGQGQAALFERP